MTGNTSLNTELLKTSLTCVKCKSGDHPKLFNFGGKGANNMCSQCVIAKSRTVFTEENTNEWIECRVCGLRGRELARHVKTAHGIDPKDYGVTKSKSSIDRVKGEDNPAYQHGGRLSPWSKKSKFYSEESHKKAIENSQEGINKNSPVRKSFYETEDEFRKAQNRDLDYFVTKYGVEVGKQKHAAKTAKWIATMEGKPDEEKQRINRMKVGRAGAISKAEKDIIAELSNLGVCVQSQLQLKKASKGWFLYDIAFQNKIIEYNGDFWHCNPNIYPEDFYNSRTKRTAKETWCLDSVKIDYAKSLGYEVLVIWETEFKADKEGTIDRCIKFLTQ